MTRVLHDECPQESRRRKTTANLLEGNSLQVQRRTPRKARKAPRTLIMKQSKSLYRCETSFISSRVNIHLRIWNSPQTTSLSAVSKLIIQCHKYQQWLQYQNEPVKHPSSKPSLGRRKCNLHQFYSSLPKQSRTRYRDQSQQSKNGKWWDDGRMRNILDSLKHSGCMENSGER